MKPYLLFLLTPIVTSLLSACGPSAEEREARRQQACLNKICQGDVLPQLDTHLEVPFKRNGRWFVAPKAYGASDGAFAFYWPSKTPMTGRPDRGNYPERGQDFYKVAIQFFVESGDQQGEMYKLVTQAEDNGLIISREVVRLGLERVLRRSESGKLSNPPLYVATNLRTSGEVPPVVSCREESPTDACTSGLQWRQGLHIYIRFNQEHGRDWPEIYQEVVRVHNLVKEGKT